MIGTEDVRKMFPTWTLVSAEEFAKCSEVRTSICGIRYLYFYGYAKAKSMIAITDGNFSGVPLFYSLFYSPGIEVWICQPGNRLTNYLYLLYKTKDAEPAAKLCSCTTRDLLIHGCKCGGK